LHYLSWILANPTTSVNEKAKIIKTRTLLHTRN
jgi:hypothetical protein